MTVGGVPGEGVKTGARPAFDPGGKIPREPIARERRALFFLSLRDPSGRKGRDEKKLYISVKPKSGIRGISGSFLSDPKISRPEKGGA